MDKIKLIIGLGNPGKEYEKTRHNVGFLFIDELASYPNFNYTVSRRSSANRIIEKQKSKVVLAKSQTFMNKSGEAVLALSKFYKIKPENILVVHDDIDILWSNFKFSFGRSSAGHKGVESVIKALKTKNFWRLRIGIHPIQNIPLRGISRRETKIRADKIIMKKFTASEEKTLSKVIGSSIKELSGLNLDS